MKYYVYISTAKVDMLFNQIHTELRKKIATELKIDLKILSTTFKEDVTSETTISKLDLVIKSLADSGEIGDLSSPKQYFAGRLNMGWGPPEFMHFQDESEKEKMVIFGGSPDEKKIVGLIGSKAHLLGETGSPVHASYARPDFLRKVAEGMRQLSSQEIADNMYGMYYATREVALFWEGNTQRVEFVAKTFVMENDILIGSPLYVALASDIAEKEAPKKEHRKAWWKFLKKDAA
jgi:hypothetical protein